MEGGPLTLRLLQGKIKSKSSSRRTFPHVVVSSVLVGVLHFLVSFLVQVHPSFITPCLVYLTLYTSSSLRSLPSMYLTLFPCFIESYLLVPYLASFLLLIFAIICFFFPSLIFYGQFCKRRLAFLQTGSDLVPSPTSSFSIH